MFPTLSTSRLILNRLEFSDVSKIVDYAGNINVAKTTSHIPHPYTHEDGKQWVESTHKGFEANKGFSFAIRNKDSKELIGAIGIHLDHQNQSGVFGYWLAEPLWSRGIITEAVKELLRFGFIDLKLNKIYAFHMIHNPASGKVMSKNNMILEGTLKDHLYKNGEFITVNQYRLTKEEYSIL